VTSKKPRPTSDVLRRWDRAARDLAARLGLKDFSVRGVTNRVALDSWTRRYYAEQPNMITPATLDPDLPTVLDALKLIPAARYAVDVDERDLIRAARHLGATWEQIGVCLGAAQATARQTARGKYTRLGGNVREAVVGKAAEQAPALVEIEPRPAPAATFTEQREAHEAQQAAPVATFVEPALLDVDQAVAGGRRVYCPAPHPSGDGTTCELEPGHGGDFHQDGGDRWPVAAEQPRTANGSYPSDQAGGA
jgi:hypothetical protein